MPDADRRLISTSSCLLPPEAGVACQRDLRTSYDVETALVPAQATRDVRASCPEGSLVGGGCSFKPQLDDDVSLLRAGFAPDDRDAWLCSWTNNEAEAQNEVMAVAFCLHENALPSECGCCPALADSIVIKQEEASLHSGANRLEVRCDDGQFLVVGNCMLDIDDISTMADVTMFRDGFPPTPDHPDGDRTRWGCSWNNPTGMTPRAIATAVCLPAE